MLYYPYPILILIISYNIRGRYACGCYGSRSCRLNGTQCTYQSSTSCLCDCCPPCNTCEQFLEFGCLENRFSKHYGLSENQSDIITEVNVSMNPKYIIDQTNGNIVRYLWNPCLRRLLPNGIYLENNNEGKYRLVGVPTEKLEKTVFEILFKGPTNLIVLVNFTLTII